MAAGETDLVTVRTFLNRIEAEIAHAEMKGNVAQVTVRFVSQLISVTRNKAGEVVSGSPDSVTHVTDVWTFAREIGARDPNWKLVSTESA